MQVPTRMIGAVLPGNSTVQLRDFDVPTPKGAQVLIRMRASSLCGSDIRAIYREHLGVGAEKYRGVIAGHEPSGDVVALGDGCRHFKPGDRVIVYHISGCRFCSNCRKGYQISCSDPARAAYGWQRDGGHAAYLLAEEADLIALPDFLTHVDGALIACGFGTAYEGIKRAQVSGRDTVLIVGLGPVGLAALMLAKACGASRVVGIDVDESRARLAEELNVADVIIGGHEDVATRLREALGGGAEVTLDASGSGAGRVTALESTRDWGRCVFIGEGGTVTFPPSRDLIHKQLTLHGSWVTSLANMEELALNLARWKLHPEKIVTNRFSLDQASAAYGLMDEGKCGKVVMTFDD